MNRKMKVFIFLIIVFILGFPMWLTSYTQYLNDTFPHSYTIILSGVCAAILAYKTVHNKLKIIMFVIAAQQTAFLIKVAIDCIADSTNHNLFPFEMIIFIICDAIICTIGVAIGSFLKTLF